MARSGKSHRKMNPPWTEGPNSPKQTIPTAMVILPVSKRAQAIVRAASLSADKTFFESRETDDLAVAEAVAAGYIVNLRPYEHVWRITARGEAYLAKLRGAH